jgi:hypothetical protein
LTNTPSGNRAILSVNLLKNSIGVDQAEALVIILKEHPTLKSLCGNKGNETELDMSGKMDGAEDAIMLAAEVVDNGGLSYKVIKKEDLISFFQEHSKDPQKMIAQVDQVLATSPVQQIVDMSMKAFETSPKVTVISKAKGALTSLDISANKLTRGTFRGGSPDIDSNYTTDITGMSCFSVT